ncbi:MAG: bifunctional alpha/beta hydrolase/class I SAM-dependent methyltransferase [Deltaproteobacteria bacterium]|nr:bifunctional alpha/beta hydrolase/class I SAM-dependent methyltransferase [Deltaproteobacteria bacterium]
MATSGSESVARQVEEHVFTTHDGSQLFYRHWPSAAGTTDRAVVLLHRGHEHSGRLQHLVDELDLPDVSFFAWDARGHGRSPGRRGHSPSLGTSVWDVDAFVGHVSEGHGICVENLAVVAQSVGAVLAAAWVHDYAPKIRGLVLASPAFDVKLYVPFARPGLKLLHALRGDFDVNSYVKARFLTHDPARIASFDADPLVTRAISVKILLALYEAANRVVADAQAIQVPTQLLISEDDWVVRREPQYEFFSRLGSAVKECHLLPGFYHDTLGERDRAKAIGRVRSFLLRRFEEPAGSPSLLDADRQGYTRDEFDALRQPLSPRSPKGLFFALSRLALRAGEAVSEGLRIGGTTGFDSGSTLDYVYRNNPTGKTVLGRWIDRAYLNSVGWRGIRVRKEHLEQLIVRAVDRLSDEGRPVRLVDIAAGHGRYILDALAGHASAPESILLRDYSDLNVRQGSALIAEKGLAQIARFEKGDAFDRASLAALDPRPTLGVVSGLYELFPDNAPVRESLAGLADAIDAGGYLVYTGQPWHPQLEFIARALSSHRGGRPWVMRRRTQPEMDQLVEAAGFRKLDERVDEWGIFTVSLAQRV